MRSVATDPKRPTSQKPCVRNRASRCPSCSFETVKIHSKQAPALRGVDTWQQIRKGRRAKNRVFATVPHGAQAAASKPLKYTVNRLRRCEVWIRGWDVCRAVYKFRRCEVWIHGWDVCRGWTKACMSWLSKQCFALLFPYASPSGKAEGSADINIIYLCIHTGYRGCPWCTCSWCHRVTSFETSS